MSPEELFNTNQTIVGWCYKKYIGDYSSIHYEDIMSEGYLALWKACKNFDESKGFQFSTYAVPCIAGAMLRYYRYKCNVIRIPRTAFDEGDTDLLSKLINTRSLDADIENHKGDNFSLLDLIPGVSDDYEYLTEDLVDSFIATISNETHRDLMEEYYYNFIWGSNEITQTELGNKYGGISQAQVSRLIKRYNRKFAEFLKQ